MHLIYVIADQNNKQCHKLYTLLKPYVKSGKLRINWVSVNFTATSKIDKETTLKQFKNFADIMEIRVEHFIYNTDFNNMIKTSDVV